jgi:ABC-type nitrate/sulfonate/bicarbonate transport system permease component
VWSVQLPACWPSVVDGLNLAAPAALAGAIFGEWYGAPRGLGVLLITAMQGARADRLWAASLLCAGCGLVAFGALALVRVLVARRYGATISKTVEVGARLRRSTLANVGVDAAGSAILVLALFLIWWLWIRLDDVSPLVAPGPGAVWADLRHSPRFYWSATMSTLVTAAIALVMGVGVGVVAALLASRARILQGLVVPVVVLLAATPLVALFPLFARVLGYQQNTVRALAAVLVFYPMFVYTRSGLVAASPSTRDVVDALGVAPSRRFRLVEVPEAVPHMVSGLRIAAGSAVIAAVVGESIIGSTGLGREFHYAYDLILLPRAFGVALAIVALSVAVFALFGSFERVVHTRWS